MFKIEGLTMRKWWPLFLVVVVLAVPVTSSATFLLWDEGVNHNEIDWKFYVTDHFVFYYYPEEELSARYLVSVAEDIYDYYRNAYNYDLPRRVNVVILDTEDMANGFAAQNFNWVTVWVSHLYYNRRGRADWLATVFAHEFGHIYSLKAANHFRANFFGVLLGYSQQSYGDNYDLGVAAFLGAENLPLWIVESGSQYGTLLYGSDVYDTHREMLLRAAVLDGNLMTLDEMDVIYDKNSLQAEMCYNQGFGMNTYLGERYGSDIMQRFFHTAGSSTWIWYNVMYRNMVKKVLGKSAEDLYNEWTEYLRTKYHKETKDICDYEIPYPTENVKGFYPSKLQTQEEINKYCPNYRRGDRVVLWDENERKPMYEKKDLHNWLEGINNLFPTYSPDGKWLAYGSSHNTQKGGPTLYIKKMEEIETINDSKPKRVARIGWDSVVSWSPDSKKLAYSYYVPNIYRHYFYMDLFVYDVESEKSTRITRGLRAYHPAWSPKGDQIAFVINQGGQQKLAVLRYPNDRGYYILLEFDDLTQIGSPKWSPDGTKIAFLMWRHGQQDVWVINADGSGLRPVTYDVHDNRDPAWMPDSKHLVFSSDRTGIFQLYMIDIETYDVVQITNVLGGAFYPEVHPDGEKIVYSDFSGYGYRIYEIKKGDWLNEKVEDFYHDWTDQEIQRNLATNDAPPLIKGRDYNVFNGIAGLFPILRGHRGTWVWIPIFVYEDERVLVGAQVLMVDAVERNLVVAEVDYGENYEVHFWYENYMLPFTTFLSLHKIFPTHTAEFEELQFHLKAMFDASFYLVGIRYLFLGEHLLYLYYFYKDIRVEQPGLRMRQYTGRSIDFMWEKESIPWAVDKEINPRDGYKTMLSLMYSPRKWREPFTGRRMGTDLNPLYNDPDVIDEEEAQQEPDEEYLLPDYSYWGFEFSHIKYLPMPFWDLTPLNDLFKTKKFDFEKLNLKGWDRLRHTLVLKFIAGFVHSDVPEGYGWGNSYGRVHWYDRFAGGGMTFSGTRAYSFNSTFLGYERYSLEGETEAILGFEYRFPIIRDIDKLYLKAFYVDSIYAAIFGDAGNLWSHVSRRADMLDPNKVFDANHDGEFKVEDDIITDIGLDIRARMFLFGGFWNSFFKVAHGFQDPERDEHPLRFYLGLGTDFEY